MSAPTTPADLLDLKLMPAWVNEPSRTNDYANYQGEDERPMERAGRGPMRDRDSRPRRPKPRSDQRDRPQGGGARRPEQRRPERRAEEPRPRETESLPQVAVRFVPHPAAFESVVTQIKSGTVTYSVFALARMFLDKPERYDVKLTGSATSPLSQLGENGPVAVDRRILEGNAFASMKDEYYEIEVTQSEPIKGNFTNVARDRASGTLLGPTNHHSYQPQLRGLYEQSYSRRMSFTDFQRGIEVVSDPAVVEQWKEQARSVTNYATKNVEPAVSFTSTAEAERHFRQTHLPTLLREVQEVLITGVVSRRLPDRALGRVIEDAWSAEIRSPSKMMQELAGGLRPAGLNIFRHRKGMLFVSPIRIQSFSHESTGVSASINAILQKFSEAPGSNRKQLAEALVAGIEDTAEVDRIKLSLASDLRWLISEGFLIEFNDGSLDLPRVKVSPPAQTRVTATISSEHETPAVEAAPGESAQTETGESTSAVAEEVGGIEVTQTIGTAESGDFAIGSLAETTPIRENESPEQAENAVPSPVVT